MSTVFIGIGSNLGNREQYCTSAIKLLIESGLKVTKMSRKFETEPWGVENQPRFINMVVKAETVLEPLKLLAILKDIEFRLGRKPDIRWGPRTIDLDILLYDDLVLNTPELNIPHTGMEKRSFVLLPLAEIAPETIHPLINKRIRELLDEIAPGPKI
jgi:2-amino-4-hydroxy-6-hydroxymethyldihydropteridine diphosphokinase